VVVHSRHPEHAGPMAGPGEEVGAQGALATVRLRAIVHEVPSGVVRPRGGALSVPVDGAVLEAAVAVHGRVVDQGELLKTPQIGDAELGLAGSGAAQRVAGRGHAHALFAAIHGARDAVVAVHGAEALDTGRYPPLVADGRRLVAAVVELRSRARVDALHGPTRLGGAVSSRAAHVASGAVALASRAGCPSGGGGAAAPVGAPRCAPSRARASAARGLLHAVLVQAEERPPGERDAQGETPAGQHTLKQGATNGGQSDAMVPVAPTTGNRLRSGM